MNRALFWLCFGLVTAAFGANSFEQGSLKPPGALAPTMNGSGTNNYNIPAGNLVGPILSTPASSLTNSNPHANFAY